MKEIPEVYICESIGSIGYDSQKQIVRAHVTMRNVITEQTKTGTEDRECKESESADRVEAELKASLQDDVGTYYQLRHRMFGEGGTYKKIAAAEALRLMDAWRVQFNERRQQVKEAAIKEYEQLKEDAS